jgi:hypothetical protein
MDDATVNILRLIIGEILNDNQIGLQVLIESLEKPEIINCLGFGGESPAHIAIFKSDETMLRQLLKAGAHPHCRNKDYDTLIHTAVRLGRIEMLQILYETKKCNLEIKDYYGRTPLDIVNMSFDDSVIVASRLYRNWSSSDPDEMTVIKEGRHACKVFLEEKVVYDRLMKIETLTLQSTETTIAREKVRRMLTGENHHYNETYLQHVYFPEHSGEELVNEEDQIFYNNYRIGIQTTARTTTIHQYVRNSLQVGSSIAEKILLTKK